MVSTQQQFRKICIVTTIAMPMKVFMGPHIRELASRYEITLVANGTLQDVVDLLLPRVRFEPVSIQRRISLVKDIQCFVTLIRIFRRENFGVVHSMTPKAGLLAMFAAALSRVPIRVHWFTGQVWASKSGLSRQFFKLCDRIIGGFSTDVLVDSCSQLNFMIAEGIVDHGQAVVLRQGSVCGVDTKRFRPNLRIREKTRAELGVPASAVLALFLGRLNRDKGIPELTNAYLAAARQRADLHLLFVGPDEAGMRGLVSGLLIGFSDRVHFVDYTNEPEVFMAASDFFVLPSHREGFGSSVLEAAACGIPAIGTRIYGLTDAIVDEETGILVPLGDPAALVAAMIKLTRDRSLRCALGEKARKRVERDFRQEHLTAALMDFYETLDLRADVMRK